MLAARIIGTETVLSHLSMRGPKVHDRVHDRVSRLAAMLLTKVKAEKLSGQVLHNVTGTLRRSINMRIQDFGSAITGAVGTNLIYAKPHELGFHQTVDVKAHLRTITQAWGRELAAPVTFMMPSHTMKMNLPERSFLRSSLEDMRGEIRAELLEAVRNAL